MLRSPIPSILALVALASTACATSPGEQPTAPSPLSCVAPLQPYLRVDLYTDKSNRNAPSGRLTDEEWKTFIEEVLVPNFPDGGTILENAGWWRRPNGTTFHGLGRTLVILIPTDAVQPDRASVRAVIAEIKKRYGPSSVGWEEKWVCAAF